MRYFSLFSGIGGLYESGMSQKELAIHYKVSQAHISRVMKKLGIKARVAKKRNQTGANNHSWKGNKAGYAAFHVRVEVARGKPQMCEVCGETRKQKYEWANLTGKYENVNDYKRMCCSCHAKYDNKIKNIINGKTI